MRIAIHLALAHILCGCSLIFVDGPTSPRPGEVAAFPDCTDSNTVPYIDAIVASAAAASLLAPSYGRSSNGEDIVAALGQIALYATSSWIGFRRVSACRQARQRFVAAQMQPITIYGPPGSVQ